MALRGRLRRAPAPAVQAPVPLAPSEPPLAGEWSDEPSFAAVALEEPPAPDPAAWTAAADPIDVTDHTVEMPALPPPARPRTRRAWRAALTLALVLGCTGAALAASGVLHRSHDDGAPPVVGSSASIAGKPAHRAKPKAVKPARHHAAARTHRRARPRPHRAAVAPARRVAAAPVRSTPVHVAPVRRVVSRPAPKPAPKPVARPKPVATTPTTTVSQPKPSAPSGEPGRQPPPSP